MTSTCGSESELTQHHVATSSYCISVGKVVCEMKEGGCSFSSGAENVVPGRYKKLLSCCSRREQMSNNFTTLFSSSQSQYRQKKVYHIVIFWHDRGVTLCIKGSCLLSFFFFVAHWSSVRMSATQLLKMSPTEPVFIWPDVSFFACKVMWTPRFSLKSWIQSDGSAAHF